MTEEWRLHASCRGMSVHLFYPERGETMDKVREAKAVCHECEVRDACLEYAQAEHERWGIWGGLSERERLRLRRKRPAA